MEIDDIPQVYHTLIHGLSKRLVLVPVYAIGWTLTNSEIYRKYKVRRYHAEEVDQPLSKRWKTLGFDEKDKNDPLIRFPIHRKHNTRDFLFIFITNDSVEDMNNFRKRKEEIFEVMCELFGIFDPEDVVKIRGRYKWHRFLANDFYMTLEWTDRCQRRE
ncbi:hypothetical protein BDQ17DRAFT_1329794 [Cyathus striatus]|nr:hypothetical protein BDQ17DRAFT_1329794 [Cyathus striatus]